MPTETLLNDLVPVVEKLVDRHLAASKEWFPHALVPWELGPEVEPERAWTDADSPLSPAVRSSLLVNLLTEDNLPYYLRDIQRMFGGVEVWDFWTRRWTAEEGRHAIVIRDYLTLTRAICPEELERARMAQVQCGQVPRPPTAVEGLAYLTMQELATRIAHRNTGRLLADDAGFEVMKRVAADENLHFLFYRDVASAALEVVPSEMVIAIDAEVRNFEMPGTGIQNFASHARAIAREGIYDFAIHHDQILAPVVLREWKLEDLVGLSDEAERARDRVTAHIARVKRVGERQRERQLATA